MLSQWAKRGKLGLEFRLARLIILTAAVEPARQGNGIAHTSLDNGCSGANGAASERVKTSQQQRQQVRAKSRRQASEWASKRMANDHHNHLLLLLLIYSLCSVEITSSWSVLPPVTRKRKRQPRRRRRREEGEARRFNFYSANFTGSECCYSSLSAAL